MHFNVVNSKLQEASLNKTICWTIGQFVSKQSDFRL